MSQPLPSNYVDGWVQMSLSGHRLEVHTKGAVAVVNPRVPGWLPRLQRRLKASTAEAERRDAIFTRVRSLLAEGRRA